jgi:BirA family transcriptional regulator, biotin operon repressor / biotin---[acetyl-CoA-carboxylase] ligase
LARRGAAEGVVLVADHQTAGRGRLGRTWQAPIGASLLFSVLLRPDLPGDRSALPTMALGVAAAEACRALGAAGVCLKWPNDVVVRLSGEPSFRKVAGMLSEVLLDGDAVDALVLGMGLNLNWPDGFPADLADTACSLNHLVGRSLDREEVLVDLLQRFDSLYASLAVDGGVDLRNRYFQHSATIGSVVEVDTGQSKVTGTAVGLGADGSLIVETGGRQTAVLAGDVVMLRPTT